VQLAAAVRASPVVVGLVVGQDTAEAAFAEDQHSVGHLGPGGATYQDAARQFGYALSHLSPQPTAVGTRGDPNERCRLGPLAHRL
jgi:hypothetical protein